LPVAIAADGRLVIALQWDTAFWSERVEQFIDYAATAKLGQTVPVVIAITGSASATTKAELAKRQIGILDHALPGPQK
jgi:UDP-N-acetylmuramyl pentapeptide synthase